jgi:hypothetical protein
MEAATKARSDATESYAANTHSELSYDRPQIEQELERILAGSSFRSSKRCTEFLRFVVHETLEGRQEALKERTLGVSLFGRTPSYDTPGDPIVRVKANEVRKRLAQYYDEHGSGALRIDLAPGSYIPVFRRVDSSAAPEVVGASIQKISPKTRWTQIAFWAILILAIATAAGLALRRDSPVDRFWGPVLRSDSAPILCVGTSSHVWVLSDRLSAELGEKLAQEGNPPDITVDAHDAKAAGDSYFSLGSVRAALGLLGYLTSRGAHPELRMSNPLSLEDFHNHTIVAVGAFSNPWTLQKLSEMRFRFERSTAQGHSELSISDSQDANRRWSVQEAPFETPSEDFALITRMFDPATNTVFVSLAGLNQFGTEAAEEFVTNPSYWEDLVQQAPKGWQTKNLQIVIRTSLVQSRPTPPRTVAVHFW